MKEDKYEKDGFIFNSKAEYYKYLIVSILLVISWVVLLVFIFTYSADYLLNIPHCPK